MTRRRKQQHKDPLCPVTAPEAGLPADGADGAQQALHFMYDFLVNGCIDFRGLWQGWKLRNRDLVAPDGARISRQRLEGLLWRDAMELRLAGYASRREAERPKQLVRVVVVELEHFRKHGVAAA
jgi:hypothetical protein